MILALKFICLLMIPLFGFNLVIGGLRGLPVSAGNVLLTSIGIAGFVTLQWLL